MKSPCVLCVLIYFTTIAHGFDTSGQHWGFVTVRPKAHMFWWLYETTADVASITERPLLIWLQGGPGGSSTGFGNFEELGPLDVDLKPRNTTWIKEYNVLFIDNPVGTGFSYVEDYSALTTSNKEIAVDLVTCLKGFYFEKPEFEDVPLYITSESYGGKMAVAFALELLGEHQLQGKQTNVKGVQLVDAWISPIDALLSWAPYLYHLGAVDKQGYDAIYKEAKGTEQLVATEKWISAFIGYAVTQSEISKLAKNIDFYNVLKPIQSAGRNNYGFKIILPDSIEDQSDKLQRLMNGPVREALNINVTWGAQSSAVLYAQIADFMKPVTHLVERILDETELIVQVITGQLDLIVATPGTVKWVDNLKWNESSKWPKVVRNALVADGYNEGYVKILGKLALYWVNRAGHMVPADNTKAMRVILKDLTGI